MTTNGVPHGQYRQSAQAAHCNAPAPASPGNAGPHYFATTKPIITSACHPYGPIETGFRAGEIIAYRAWRLDRDEMLLGSMFMGHYRWTPRGVEHAKYIGLEAGLHAFKDLAHARREYGHCHGILFAAVLGEVALWGEVIEHEFGYRAEFAQIRQLLEIHYVDVWRFFRRSRWPRQKLNELREKYAV